MIRIGSHVGMNGKEMMLGSAKEAASYGANVFMAYTGAPQNTRRKEISELNIDKAWEYMDEHGIDEVVIHAPYIINLANTVKPETYELAVEFLAKEIERAQAMRAKSMVLHPGSHVGAGKDRHENIGKGCIGFETLHKIVHLPEFERVPKILETPYIKDENDSKNSYPPYKEEIAMLRK